MHARTGKDLSRPLHGNLKPTHGSNFSTEGSSRMGDEPTRHLHILNKF